MKKGIMLKSGKRAFYLDCRGKDISFNRWRIDAYYATHFAETLFFDSEEKYLAFIAGSKESVFADYVEYVKAAGA